MVPASVHCCDNAVDHLSSGCCGKLSRINEQCTKDSGFCKLRTCSCCCHCQSGRPVPSCCRPRLTQHDFVVSIFLAAPPRPIIFGPGIFDFHRPILALSAQFLPLSPNLRSRFPDNDLSRYEFLFQSSSTVDLFRHIPYI